MRDTPYATEIKTANDSIGQTIERIFVKELQREEIRFSWWKDGNLVIHPLDLPEQELLPLMCEAIRTGVFSAEFLEALHEALYDIRRETTDTMKAQEAWRGRTGAVR